MAVFETKRGDSFAMTCVRRTSPTGDAIDLTGASIRAQLRFYSEVRALTPTLTDAENGTFTLGATAAQTATWTPGRWQCDIEITLNGAVASSDTFSVTVTPDVTI